MTVATALPSRAVDDRRGAEALRHFKAIVVEIDHDDLGRRVELRREQRGEPDRSRADDRHRAPRLNLAVEHAALEAGRQDVAEHHQRLFVGAIGNGIEARIRIGNADELGLGAVDLVAEDPAAGGAVRVHQLPAIVAFAAGGDAGDQDAVSRLERGDGRPDLVDDADALMAENAARLTGRDVALEDVQVGAANRRFRHLDDRVGRRRDFRVLGALAGLSSPGRDKRVLSPVLPLCRNWNGHSPLRLIATAATDRRLGQLAVGL